MPRTTYSDFSLPNLSQDLEHERRYAPKRKAFINKKRSRNIAKPNRKKMRSFKLGLKKLPKFKGAFSPQHKVYNSDDDSASFQSDCIDKRLEDDFPVDRTEDTVPVLGKECEDMINRLVEESERRELIGLVEEFRLTDQESFMGE